MAGWQKKKSQQSTIFDSLVFAGKPWSSKRNASAEPSEVTEQMVKKF